MEGEVCSHQKFGFCKFKNSCKNHHLEEICPELSTCFNTKSCHKRHPKKCKRYEYQGFCRFGSGCAYYHQENTTNLTRSNNLETNIKVEKLEKMVKDMAEKIVSLESKVKEMKSIELNKVREAAKTIKDPNKINKKKDTSNNLQI